MPIEKHDPSQHIHPNEVEPDDNTSLFRIRQIQNHKKMFRILYLVHAYMESYMLVMARNYILKDQLRPVFQGIEVFNRHAPPLECSWLLSLNKHFRKACICKL